jgi:ATP-dependent RNA helicase RhlE
LVEVARRNAPAEMVSQSVIRCDQDKKKDLLLHLFAQHGWHQTLIFCRTKHGADALAKRLEHAGVKTAALHGNKSQGARTRALADFKSGRLAALVATDIAARGIDIDDLPRVVNFELPHVPEDYIHRIGRTGRAGLSGEALSFVSLDERIQLRDIERLLKRELDSSVIEGFEPLQTRPTPKVATPVRRSAPSRNGDRNGDRSGDRGGDRNGGRAHAPRGSHSTHAPRSGSGKPAGATYHTGQRQR